MEHVVPQHERAGPACEELPPDQERLGEPARLRLLGVLQAHAEVLPAAQKLAVGGQVARRRDDEHLTYPGEHEHGERVVHERLVVDRQQLLADRLRYGVQARAGAAREDYAFHKTTPIGLWLPQTVPLPNLAREKTC